MKSQTANEIIEILEEYRDMIGTDTERCNQLIESMKNDNTVIESLDYIDTIIHKVSKITGISIEEIKSEKRHREIVMARSYAIYRVYEDIYLKSSSLISLGKVGTYFGNRDHATILSAHKRVKSWIEIGDSIVMNIHNDWNTQIEQMELTKDEQDDNKELNSSAA